MNPLSPSQHLSTIDFTSQSALNNSTLQILHSSQTNISDINALLPYSFAVPNTQIYLHLSFGLRRTIPRPNVHGRPSCTHATHPTGMHSPTRPRCPTPLGRRQQSPISRSIYTWRWYNIWHEEYQGEVRDTLVIDSFMMLLRDRDCK